MTGLSDAFYTNHFDSGPRHMDRDTSKLCALGSLPPRVAFLRRPATRNPGGSNRSSSKWRRPSSACGSIRGAEPTGTDPSCKRITVQPSQRNALEVRPATALEVRPATALEVRPATAKTRLIDYLFTQPASKSKPKQKRPQSAAPASRRHSKSENPGIAQAAAEAVRKREEGHRLKKGQMAQMIERYQSKPVNVSRKRWCRINPGHTLEPWKSTYKTISCPEYDLSPHYSFDKEFHNHKTEFLYVPKRKESANRRSQEGDTVNSFKDI